MMKIVEVILTPQVAFDHFAFLLVCASWQIIPSCLLNWSKLHHLPPPVRQQPNGRLHRPSLRLGQTTSPRAVLQQKDLLQTAVLVQCSIRISSPDMACATPRVLVSLRCESDSADPSGDAVGLVGCLTIQSAYARSSQQSCITIRAGITRALQEWRLLVNSQGRYLIHSGTQL